VGRSRHVGVMVGMGQKDACTILFATFHSSAFFFRLFIPSLFP